MDTIEIIGGNPLEGSVRVQGSKNAVLPMMAAALLTDDEVVLQNCPRIDDVFSMMELLESLGRRSTWKDHVLVIEPGCLSGEKIGAEPARRMRSSITLLGPLLARRGRAVLPSPGGCTIGKRPIDLHLEGLGRLGVSFRQEEGTVEAVAEVLVGGDVRFWKKSVGASENCIMAAVLAKGVTRLFGVSVEPEVLELCSMLRRMGAIILRTDYDELMIKGVERLRGITHRVPPDRIVAGTYVLAAAATRGRVVLQDAPLSQLTALTDCVRRMGGTVRRERDGIVVDGRCATGGGLHVRTGCYPEFPTDLQSQLVTVLTVAEEPSVVEEQIFEARFQAARQLVRMNARIHVDGRKLQILPVKELVGAEVWAEDLRGGAALVMAGLMARGTTLLRNCRYVFRGYEDIVGDFRSLGGQVTLRD